MDPIQSYEQGQPGLSTEKLVWEGDRLPSPCPLVKGHPERWPSSLRPTQLTLIVLSVPVMCIKVKVHILLAALAVEFCQLQQKWLPWGYTWLEMQTTNSGHYFGPHLLLNVERKEKNEISFHQKHPEARQSNSYLESED